MLRNRVCSNRERTSSPSNELNVALVRLEVEGLIGVKECVKRYVDAVRDGATELGCGGERESMSALGSPWRCRQSTDVQGIECVVVVVRRRQAERLQTRQSRQSRKWGESNSSATRRGRFRRRGAQLGRAQLRRTGRSVFAPSAAVQSQRGPPPKRPGGDWGVFDPRAVRERQRAKRHNCGQRSQCRVSLEQSWHGHRPLREKGTGAATVKLRAPGRMRLDEALVAAVSLASYATLLSSALGLFA